MIEIKPTLLTGDVRSISDSDGNVILLQNKQEVKLTLSQVKEHYTLDRAIEYANSPYAAPEIKVCLLDAIVDYKSIYGGEHV